MEHSTPTTRPSSAKRIYKVVLTGGPCGGKTTGQSRLCTFFENLGWKVYRVPETATILLSGGIKFADLTEAETHKFQENLLLAMLQIENVFMELAESCKKNCLIICDRGTMDASAFITAQAWDAIMANNHFNPVELRDNRYNQIIHMVSAAVGAEDFYSTEDHVVRSENLELACELDRKAGQAWIGHPYFDVIDNTSDFDTKIKRMISMVCQKIGVDTGDRLKNNARKMKYFVAGPMPPDDHFPKFQDFTVEHVYLRTNSRKMQARIRKRGADGNHSYTYTIRKPEKLGQIVEVRTQVTQRDWNTAKGQADDQHFPVYKTRRCFLHNDQYFQLDIYRQPCHSRCEGLMLLETYSTLTGDEMKKRLPSFLNVMEEVTGNPKYSMFNLSLRDDWSNTTKFCVNIAGKEEAPPSTSSTSSTTTTPSTSTTITCTTTTTNTTLAAPTADEDGESNRREWADNSSSDWLAGGEERRSSECGGSEWDYYQNKIAKSLPPPRPDVCNGEDDQFYEDMDKRYNGNRRRKEMMKKMLNGGSESGGTNGLSSSGGGLSNGTVCSNGSLDAVQSAVNGKEDGHPKQTVVGK